MKLKSQLLAILLSLAGPVGLHALTLTWTGAAMDGLWSSAGNWDLATVPSLGDGVLFTGVPLSNCTIDSSPSVGHVALDGTFTGTVTLGTANTFFCDSLAVAAGTFNALQGTLDIEGDLIQSGGDLHPSGGTTKVGGNVAFSGGTYYHYSATLRLDGSSNQSLSSVHTLGHVQVMSTGGVVSLVGDLKLDGDWNLLSGTVDPGTSTLVLQGMDQTINGNCSFYNLRHTAPSPAQLKLGGNLTVGGHLELRGLPGSLLVFKSDLNMMQRTVTLLSTQDLQYLEVKDLVALPAAVASDSNDLGNNLNWSFPVAPTPTATPLIIPACYQVGKFGSDGGATQFSGSLNGQQVVVPLGGLLNHVFVTANSVTQGAPLKLGIYTDAGNYPGTLVTELPQMFEHASGLNAYPGTGVYLPAGTYWVVAGANGSYTVFNNWETTVATQLSWAYSGSLPASYPGGASVYTTFHWKLGIDLCNVPASPTPTRTGTPTNTPSPSISPTSTLTPGPLSPAFGFTSYGGGSYSSLKSATDKVGSRFPQRGNKSLDEFSIYVLGITGAPPQYRYALYPDDNGQPGAVALYSLVSAVAPGWNSFPIPPQALADGQVYHVVVEPDTTPPDGSNYIDVMFQYGQRVWTLDQVADDILAGGTGNGSSWAYGTGPVLGLHYSDGKRDGGSFQTFSSGSIYGSLHVGQSFKAPAGGATVGGMGLQFQKTGSPADDLYYRIFNVTQASAVASGVLSSPALAPLSSVWMDADLGTAVILNDSDTYRIELSSPGSTAGNGYSVLTAFTGGGPISLHDYTYGGAAIAMENSTNSGATFNPDGGQDLFFRFNFGKVAAPAATSTRTAVATASPSTSPTPTLSPTVTPSATPSASQTDSPTASATPTATPSATPSVTPSATSTATPTPTATPSSTGTGTLTSSPTPSATASDSATATLTATVTPSDSATSTSSPSPTSSFSSTRSATPSASPSLTPSATASASVTKSVTPSATVSATVSSTQTATRSATVTATLTPMMPLVTGIIPASGPEAGGYPISIDGINFLPGCVVTIGGMVALVTIQTTLNIQAVVPAGSGTGAVVVTNPGGMSSNSIVFNYQVALPTNTLTITETPQPTGTPNVPAVLDHNVWRPASGRPLRIGIKAPRPGKVVVNVFNVAGERVRRPFEADVPADITVEAFWDGKNEQGEPCGAGLYVVSVQGAGISTLKKVVMLK